MAENDILTEEKKDRRLLSHVPDADGHRTNRDRRRIKRDKDGNEEKISFQEYVNSEKQGQRYEVDLPVEIVYYNLKGKKIKIKALITDISSTGVLIELPDDGYDDLAENTMAELTFEITAGSMPEGYEMNVKKMKAKCVRRVPVGEGVFRCGFQFSEPLAQYVNRKRGRYLLAIASFFLLCVSLVIVLMRVESVVYFKFNKFLYMYSIIAAVFLLTRYLFATFYRPVDIDENFILKEIDSNQIETNIRDNKSAFEYDANNFSKYVFLLNQFTHSNNSPVNGIK